MLILCQYFLVYIIAYEDLGFLEEILLCKQKFLIFFTFQICLRSNKFDISMEEMIVSYGVPFLTILLLTLLTDAYTFRMNKTSLDIPIKATSISCITNIVFMSALGKETAEKYSLIYSYYVRSRYFVYRGQVFGPLNLFLY